MKRFLLPLVISFFAFIGCQRHPNAVTWTLTYTIPAQIWEECFPLGNGHLGMMPDGGVEKETIVLNDITLWSGAPSDDSNPLGLAVAARNPTALEGRQERRSPKPDV